MTTITEIEPKVTIRDFLRKEVHCTDKLRKMYYALGSLGENLKTSDYRRVSELQSILNSLN